MDKDTNLEFSEVVKNLAGEENNLDNVYLEVLVKNSGSHGLIDSAEEIALKKGKDKSDDSSLGGYTGGR